MIRYFYNQEGTIIAAVQCSSRFINRVAVSYEDSVGFIDLINKYPIKSYRVDTDTKTLVPVKTE
jgi:hypothetical protein